MQLTTKGHSSFCENMFPKCLTLINHVIFNTVATLQYMGKHLSMQQETKAYVSGFPLGCSLQLSLMEREP
jgi:hypothetical protein